MPRWIRRPLRRLYRFFRYTTRTLSTGPPIVGLLILLLLWWPPQMSEIYLGLGEGAPVLIITRGALALACLLLLSFLLYRWHMLLSTPQISEIYEEFPDPRFDRTLLRVRNGKALACALLPMVGVLLGIWEAHQLAAKTCANLRGALELLSWKTDLGADCATAGTLARLSSIKLLLVTLAVIGGGALLWDLAHRIDENDRWRSIMLGAGGAVAVLAVAGPMLVSPSNTIAIAWAGGPAIAVLVVLTAGVAMLMGLSWLSRLTGFPILAALLLYGVVKAGLGLQGNVAPATSAADTASIREHDKDKDNLAAQFRAWLAKRRPNPGVPYPVFIFAAEGGGIYAASGIALFLAALQDQNPRFAEHVFAISAVSGGAVGSSVFHALLDQPIAGAGRADAAPADSRKVTTNVDRILGTDHLSPIVALVLPDIFANVLPFSSGLNRASALERSLTCAFESRQRPANALPTCPGDVKASRLTQDFESHWQDGSGLALILNSTWVETGFRVAFGPKAMPLKGVGDSTLYSFSDLPESGDSLSLIGAAVASARFPLIAPPWVVKHSGRNKLWNFVDGGYADNSGSTTALEIYRALKEPAAAAKADLYLVILTDAVAVPDPLKINGSGFSDTMAPISALLNVRSQLASRAITQAIDYFKPDNLKDVVARSETRSKLLIARLEQRSVPLTLGWHISQTEFDLVRLMLGSPELCRSEAPQSKGASAAEKDVDATTETIVDNSCIKKRIGELVAGSPSR